MTPEAANKHPEIERLVATLRSGDARALGRAISLVENDTAAARHLLSACFPHIGKALRVGVTGAPGAGKSTLVDALAKQLRAKDHTVGIVAVDPTSPFSGGAILGDRIRMQSHHADPGLFIRSMATRGFLGGMARTTADVALVVEASGKDTILLETVGVGQDEVDVMRVADVTVVVLVPGMGDDVQSIKAGLMEIADVFVINKSDRDGADRVEREIRAMQSLTSSHSEWVAPVVKTIATTGEGISSLLETINRFSAWLSESGDLQRRRALAWQKRMSDMAREELIRRLAMHGLDAEVFAQHAATVSRGDEDPYELIPRLLQNAWAGRGQEK
jgi:LAO/AO transport system kinase